MEKILVIPILFLLACLLSGLYGAIHNQISYTISPDYFHQFKFIQFRIDPSFQNRVGASIVGWIASWWMGIVIGLFIIPIGLIVPGVKRYFIAVIRSFGVVAATTMLVGLIALVVAFFLVDSTPYSPVVRYGKPINDSAAFMRAGIMHSFSYIGGLLGILTGIVHIFLERKQANKRVRLPWVS